MSQKVKLTHSHAAPRKLGAREAAASLSDKALVKAALAKMERGETPTAREAEALRRTEKARAEAARWASYRAVPAKDYKTMSGRSARVLIDQERKWKIPVSGSSVDVTLVVRWIHDFIADNSHRLLPDERVDANSKSMERFRNASAEKIEMELGQIRGQLLRREIVEEVAVMLVDRLIQCMNTLETKVAMEFAIWLADEKIRAMAADKRGRLVREFVAKTCLQIRELESRHMLGLIDEKQNQEMGTAPAKEAG